ncbi:MAG: M61 family peptidase, partial [Proteobacteria bacterium]|nr:M61 family peptidase [Pseudomonadota bacterium]
MSPVVISAVRALVLTAILGASFAARAAPTAPAPPTDRAFDLLVDARDAPRRLVHATLTIPVRPGPVTLVFPRWAIPTDEMPSTVLNNVVGLTITAGGRPLEWQRNPLDLFKIQTNVPTDVSAITASLDVVAPDDRTDLNAATGRLFIIDWQTVLVYPLGTRASDARIHARLQLPDGWSAASALANRDASEHTIDFEPVSIAELVDSPVQTGASTVSVAVDAPGPPVTIDVAADTAEAATVPAIWHERIQRIVAEAGALFGGYPYRRFRFLLTLADSLGNDGLEHRESADIRLRLAGLSAEPNRIAYGYLIPHEYVHAWNGKAVVPAGVVRSDFETPQDTSLLWVYEGLTRYLNWELAARAGVLTPAESRDYVALLAARLTVRSGRSWRPLQDTATSGRILNPAPEQWESLRRSTDYYDEGLLIWLEVDATLRRLTAGRRSLDDFCRSFFGAPAVPSARRVYKFDDVVRALESIAPYDWQEMLRGRLNTIDQSPTLAGLEASGWTLGYGPTIGSVQAARDTVRGMVEERFSVGMLVAEDGAIVDVVRDSPAWRAGLGPGMHVTGVGGEAWSVDAFRNAIATSIT